MNPQPSHPLGARCIRRNASKPWWHAPWSWPAQYWSPPTVPGWPPLPRSLRAAPSALVTGALIMAMDVTLKAPHGGIFVFFAIGKLLWFLVALAAGTVIGALAVIAARQFVNPKSETGANAAFAHT